MNVCAEAGLALDLLDAQIRAATPPVRKEGVRFIREMKPGETWTPLGNGRLLISHPNNPVLVIDVDALEP